jgi:hypothetical protein
MNRIDEMITDIYCDINGPCDDDCERIIIRDYRNTTQLMARVPEAFYEAVKAIQDRGWVPTDKLDPKNLTFGVEFDCDPKVSVVMSLQDVNEWVKRYVDGKTRTPVPMLAESANRLAKDDGTPMISRILGMMAAEATYVSQRNRKV